MTMEQLREALVGDAGNPGLLDPATGAISREAFTLRVEEACALGVRLGHGVSLIIINLLWPVAIPGVAGDAVDAVLSGMVDRVWGQARRSDTVARVGAARLALLLPATHEDGATLYASRLRMLLAEPYAFGAAEIWPRLHVLASGSTPATEPDAAYLLALIDAA